MTDNIIELQNVMKLYQKGEQPVKVFDNLNLTIARGEFLAIMGPSGAGKTSLLNMIGGIDRPNGGKILVDGVDIVGLSSRKLASWRSVNIGFVFQFFNLLPMLTAQRNVELPLLLTDLNTQERERHAKIALQAVGLENFMSRKPRELSGGQEQRVAIARALVSDPPLLLCDEPTGNLDRNTADEIMSLLQTLNKTHGKTIVMVTHDPKAARWADRCLNCENSILETAEVEA